MKPYYLLLLILILFPQSSHGGLIIDQPIDREIDTSLGKKHNMKFTVQGDTASPDVSNGVHSVKTLFYSGTCPGTFERGRLDVTGTWLAGKEIEIDIVAHIDEFFNLNALMLDAQKTIIDDEKGRFVCFFFWVKFQSFQGVTDQSKTYRIRIFEESLNGGDGFFADLPINNYYFIGLLGMALIYRRRVAR